MQLTELPQLYLHVEPCLTVNLLALQLMSKLGLDPSTPSGLGAVWASGGVWAFLSPALGSWFWLCLCLAALLSVAAPVSESLSWSYNQSQMRECVSPSTAFAIFSNVNHLSNLYSLCSIYIYIHYAANPAMKPDKLYVCLHLLMRPPLIVCHSSLVPSIGKFRVIEQMSDGAAICVPRCGFCWLYNVCQSAHQHVYHASQ